MSALEKIKQGKRLTAASHALKINTATNAGALSQIEYAFKVEVYG